MHLQVIQAKTRIQLGNRRTDIFRENCQCATYTQFTCPPHPIKEGKKEGPLKELQCDHSENLTYLPKLEGHSEMSY